MIWATFTETLRECGLRSVPHDALARERPSPPCVKGGRLGMAEPGGIVNGCGFAGSWSRTGKQSLSQLRCQLPLHNGAFGSCRSRKEYGSFDTSLLPITCYLLPVTCYLSYNARPYGRQNNKGLLQKTDFAAGPCCMVALAGVEFMNKYAVSVPSCLSQNVVLLYRVERKIAPSPGLFGDFRSGYAVR